MSQALDLNQPHLYQAFSVLVVDDEVGMQLVLKKALNKWFSRVDSAGSIEDAEVLRGEHHYDLLILDINLPGRSGIEWEEAFTDPDHRADVIFMTGYADLETAISALKLGASDFILKPFNLEQMLQAVQRCMNKRLNERLQYALQRDFQRHCTTQIIGSSVQTELLKQRIVQFAPSRASVLIEGESGTGKELVARGIHEASGRQGPLCRSTAARLRQNCWKVNCLGTPLGHLPARKRVEKGYFAWPTAALCF